MKHCGSAPPASRSGSALLVTLLTVSLLVGILLTFVVTVRIELRKVAAHQESRLARSNAMLASELAVALLQETLGPDTRASSRGDLFQGGGNLAFPGLETQEGKRFWTAAWDSQEDDERDEARKGFLGWLVSGGGVLPEMEVQSAAEDGSVPLLAGGSVGQSGDEVRAPRVRIGTTGAYAFWVADEGVKARFNLEDAHREADTAEARQVRRQSAQRLGAETLRLPSQNQSLAAAGLFPEDSPEFRRRRNRMLGPQQLALLGWNEEAEVSFAELGAARFHDITFTSRGILSNTREGGLKRDLTLAFEMPLGDFLSHDFFGAGSPLAEPMPFWPGPELLRPPMVPVFRLEGEDLREALLGRFPENGPEPGRNPIRHEGPVIRGAPWQLLRNFYRMYKARDPDRGVYGLPVDLHREIGGRRVYAGQSQWPHAQAWELGRRFGQDVNAWTHSEIMGPVGSDYSEAVPMGRPIIPNLSPLITRVQLIFSVRSHPIPEAPGFFRIDLYIDPIVTLMNPYDVPILTGPGAAQSLEISLEAMHFGFQGRLNGGPPMFNRNTDHITERASILFDSPPYNRVVDEFFRVRLNVGDAMLMEPGEVVFFSGARGEPVPYERTAGNSANSPSGVVLDLQPGLSAFLPGESGVHFPDAFREGFEMLINNESAARRALREGRTDLMGRRTLVRDDGSTVTVTSDRVAFAARALDARMRISGGADRDPVTLDRLPFFEGFDGTLTGFSTSFTPFIEVDLPEMLFEKRPFAVMDWAIKPSGHDAPFFLMEHHNLRAPVIQQGREAGFLTRFYRNQDDMTFVTGHTTTDLNPIGAWLAFDGRNSFWGPSNTAAGLRRVPLFSVPRLPMQSLAGFQHLMLQQMGDDPGLIFGNARAPLFGLPGQKVALQQMRNMSFGGGKNQGQAGRLPARRPDRAEDWTLTRPDWSYLYNEALWDGFFFSTLPSAEVFDQMLQGQALANGTLRFRGSEADRADLFSGTQIQPQAPERVAAHLLREGAFNVNSASVEAWRALLSSTRGLTVDLADRGTPVEVEGTVFSRSILPEDQENQVWRGFRNLSDAQVDQLAQEIVREVRRRGPFLNLADFVNRRLVPAGDESQWAGTLQAAIDRTDINQQGFERTLRTAGRTATNFFTHWIEDRLRTEVDDPQDHPLLNLPILANAPGYLNQADLLSVIGPLLTVRSDTFTVRAFGEFGGASAWTELTVQRLPEFLEDFADPWVHPDEAGPINQRFGRRFVVTSFRWLGEDEI